ncbi:MULTISPECIES: DUF2130 domain-containing protein [unclassified Campylobacter]|uniref:DUF2130 domain-containing protein n=1 Tax=unclassified Campylobacter TaxID=2593542 RepID=UPI0022E9B0E4|nr:MULTISPECIES: DUF2130 domain-containing protein [unclassified Campylobacter]MDA3062801.1 DUF2130 domain-containing protein [Campylobacter sp. JMF_14 EL1]MDA3073695.1 DUF2130 domain-containing protein [Campylobacter sp. JMF_10 EL2]
MSEIKCPNCGEIFAIDESEYQKIVSQIRNSEFEKILNERLQNENAKFQSELELVKSQEIARAKEYIANLKAQKDSEISQLKEILAKSQAELKGKDENLTQKFEIEKSKISLENEAKIAELNQKIIELNAKISASENEKNLAVSNAISSKDSEISELKITLSEKEKNFVEKEQILRENFEKTISDKDAMIDYYKDLKAKLSTKMVGESLETHCSTEFEKLRTTAFANAYFEKDNEVKEGGKGDFIFRDFKDGVEYISIMFEMKNEADTTASKHKNEEFFAKLDKDRKAKNCEYAVLVSLLESDSELYNTGIVDVSHKYEKMYVIRPQFFLPIISLLRNAALNSLEDKKRLVEYQNQNLDIETFKSNIDEFKDKFGKNYRLASEKFQKAIDEIDKTISHLEKVKNELLSSENNLRLANDKAEKLTIKKLTNNAPSVQKMFDEAGQNSGE